MVSSLFRFFFFGPRNRDASSKSLGWQDGSVSRRCINDLLLSLQKVSPISAVTDHDCSWVERRTGQGLGGGAC